MAMAAAKKQTGRAELLAASDAEIEDAVKYADPMVLRALLYQLTADPELVDLEVKKVLFGFYEGRVPVSEDGTAMLRRKAADFLKTYRDSGAGPIDIGPRERLPKSISLIFGVPIPDHEIGLYMEELALEPWARSLEWKKQPDAKAVTDFSVTIIGAGMGGLNAAIQLGRAGIPYTVIEKNAGVGGTWYENRYPGARVDTPSRSYTHLFGADFGYPNPFCPWTENVRYFDWVADTFGLRDKITFNTEVTSLTWDESSATWEIRMKGPDGDKVQRSRAVITAVGFLNRPHVAEIEGAKDFAGQSWHTSRWPAATDLSDKRVAVIGTGATGLQMIPEVALQAKHLTVFQRTPQWLFPIPGYRSPFPDQVGWLDRNLPFHTNFMRCRTAYSPFYANILKIDPNFNDPYSRSASNKAARDFCIEFLESKFDDPKMIATMTPPHPVLSARPVMVDPEYSVLDALKRNNVTLVTSGVARINKGGVLGADGIQHDVDVIVYATGFHPTEYLFPMTITGRDNQTIEQLWAKDGARAYRGCMMPGFPNLWSIYGPNTNGALGVSSFHEMVNFFAMQCIERLILNGERSVEVSEDAYWRYNHLIDERNKQCVWSDPRAHNYYWTEHGRSAVMNPLTGPEMWRLLQKPDFADLVVR
jgi:4-hydroxyacetophenone monooxygenase